MKGSYTSAYYLLGRSTSVTPCFLLFCQLANVVLLQGEGDDAIELFSDLIEVWPKLPASVAYYLPTLHNNLGCAYGLKGELKKTREQFECALQLNATHSEALNNILLLNELETMALKMPK